MAQGSRPVIAVVVSPRLMGEVLPEEALASLREFADVLMPAENADLAAQAPEMLAGADGCLMSWGSPRLSGQILDGAPRLKILAYAAGSVRGVVSPELYDRGVVVTSSAAAIASEVAAYTVGAVLLGLKQFFPATRKTRAGQWGRFGSDVTRRTVSIIGAGHVGRAVIAILRTLPFHLDLALYDPYVQPEEAEAMGVRLVSLEQALSEGDVVSVHAPALPATRDLLNETSLRLLKDNSTLINCARGSVVNAADLSAELERRPTLQAIIDVTDPEEPPAVSHPYRHLPNVALTPHIAGSTADARALIGEMAIEELRRFFVTHEPPRFPVTKAMLDVVA